MADEKIPNFQSGDEVSQHWNMSFEKKIPLYAEVYF
jgi:hypothetical protein